MRWLIGLVVFGAVGYGGYHVYCQYQVKEKRHRFNEEAQDLNQALLHFGRDIGPDDIRAVVKRFAERAHVMLNAADITPFIEPMTPENVRRLPAAAQMALGMASRFKDHHKPPLVVGFRARIIAAYGMVSERFEEQHYTWWKPW